MISRRIFALTAGALLAHAAGAAHATGPDEISLGAADAPVRLIEYASLTCPHCAQFHATNWNVLRSEYIDRGRVHFTIRELATPPAGVAVGMFQLARCGDATPDEYFRRVSILFAQQQAILGAGSGIGIRDALVRLGGEWGLAEAQVMASLTDASGVERIRRSMARAQTDGVTGTPAFLLNGTLVTDHAFHTPEGMRRILDAV